MNLENTIKEASKKLKYNNISSYSLDAEVILANILGVKRESLIINSQKNITQIDMKKYNKSIRRCRALPMHCKWERSFQI